MTDAMKEMFKEGGRLVIFAAVAALVSFLLNTVVPTLPSTSTTMILTLVLRMVDKWVHENEDVKANGLTPW